MQKFRKRHTHTRLDALKKKIIKKITIEVKTPGNRRDFFFFVERRKWTHQIKCFYFAGAAVAAGISTLGKNTSCSLSGPKAVPGATQPNCSARGPRRSS